MKKHEKNSAAPLRKSSPLLKVLKVILAVLTLIYPLFMVILSGAGLVYNSDSYGAEITQTGVFLIVSGILMTLGTVLVLFRKNILPLILSSAGFALCLTMLFRLTDHADRAGWSDAVTMEPISAMYMTRILPVIAPYVLTVLIALIQFFSYEAAEKRRQKKQLREQKENEPAPPII